MKMKEYTKREACRLIGLMVMIASVFFGAFFAVLFDGFALLFFGVTFIVGLVMLAVASAIRRTPASTATSS